MKGCLIEVFKVHLYVKLQSLPKMSVNLNTFSPLLQKTVDAHPPMLCRVPSALRWVQNVDGVFTRISSQVDQGVSAVILFPI